MPTPLLTDFVFETAWPDPRKRWVGDVKKIGVYAIVWEQYCYVGMTVSVNGFQSRWSKHHRNLFVKKRRIASPKLKQVIKDHGLTKDAFTLYALKAWEFPEGGLSKELVDKIALSEQAEYDRVEALGFTMVNTVRPTGAGYTTAHVVVQEKPGVTKTYEGETLTALVLEGKDASGRRWKATARPIRH